MNKKHKHASYSLFDEYRNKQYPNYTFKWKQVNDQIEIDPSRFIYSGTLYEASELSKKPRYYTLTLDILIVSPIMKKRTKDVKESLKKTPTCYYLQLINPRLQKLSCDGKYGIRLVADNLVQNLLCESKEDMQRWFDALKRIAILENLEGSYELKQFIGSGSSAVVRIGTCIDNPTEQYAIKSFPKRNYIDKVYSFVSIFG
jgi:hypothetical protein